MHTHMRLRFLALTLALGAQSMASATVLVGKVLDLADYLRTHALHRQGAQFNKLTMVVLVSLDAYTPWMAAYLASASTNADRAPQADHLLHRVVDVVVSCVHSVRVRMRPRSARTPCCSPPRGASWGRATM
jgi:hypothetical protein